MLVIDAEWPTKSKGIHMVGVLDTQTSDYRVFYEGADFANYIDSTDDAICGHRLIYSDLPRFRDHWGVDLTDREAVDTYTLATLLYPNHPDNRGHGLAEWGARLGMAKGEFTDFDEPADGEDYNDWLERMADYMEQDVRLTGVLYRHLIAQLTEKGFSQQCVVTELQIAKIVQKQIETGFYFDIDSATQLYVKLTSRINKVRAELQELFPPIITKRRSAKTGKQLKDGVEVFNPGSRIQVANRLIAKGVKLTEKTPKGQWKISDEILEHIKHPAAAQVYEYLMLEKLIGQLDQWLYYFNEDTHRIHGKVNPLGAVTHRQTQSKPNLAQIPSLRKSYGKQCRELFTVPEHCKLVGVDASSLELRLLAHRMKDPEFKKQVEEGDVHDYNMRKAGLNDRDQAKTFIYAFIYGARDPRLASILGCSVAEAGAIRSRFLQNIPAYEEFKERAEAEVEKTGTLTLLDGSKVWVNRPYLALNYQLQGDGAVVMKRALCLAQPGLAQTSAKLAVQAHDEWQFETAFYDCDLVGKVAVKAIEAVTEEFNMYVSLTGEYKVGKSWADTH